MTTLTTDVAGWLTRIHETAYWRILLHPTEYDPQRLPTLKECRAAVEAASVRLRGWDYPHIGPPPDEYVYGDGWIQSGSDFGNHVEVWRFYQSGQFIHQRAALMQRIGPYEVMTDPLGGEIRPGPQRVDFVEILYATTEVLEFARNLAYRGVLNPSALLTIELHNATGHLVLEPPGRVMVKTYKYRSAAPILWRTRQPAPALVAKAPEFALQATVAILERFGGLDVSHAMLEADQCRFLERRV